MPAFTPNRFVVEVDDDAGGGCGPKRSEWISEAGGLTQFGALVEMLPPGSRSSVKHWHSAEDEMIYVLEGEITLIEGDAVGHYLENRSAAPTRCLTVGTRAPIDVITCPDHDRICLRDRSLPDDIWTDTAGKPAGNPYRE